MKQRRRHDTLVLDTFDGFRIDTVHTSHVSDVGCKMVQSSKAKGTVLKDQLRLVDFVCPQSQQ